MNKRMWQKSSFPYKQEGRFIHMHGICSVYFVVIVVLLRLLTMSESQRFELVKIFK